MNITDRAEAYNAAFPKRPKILATGGMVVGTWMIGSCYKNPNPLYGAYPYGYLERVHAMFPDARSVLHVFSGGLWEAAACCAAWPGQGKGENIEPPDGCSMELVDMHGPDEGRYPTWQGNMFMMPDEWEGRFDLILADPVYSAEDAKKYDCPPTNRRAVMARLRQVAAPGANLVFLDTCWPQHRKTDWKTWGTIGLVRSTNHRVRLVSIFQAV